MTNLIDMVKNKQAHEFETEVTSILNNKVAELAKNGFAVEVAAEEEPEEVEVDADTEEVDVEAEAEEEVDNDEEV